MHAVTKPDIEPFGFGLCSRLLITWLVKHPSSPGSFSQRKPAIQDPDNWMGQRIYADDLFLRFSSIAAILIAEQSAISLATTATGIAAASLKLIQPF